MSDRDDASETRDDQERATDEQPERDTSGEAAEQRTPREDVADGQSTDQRKAGSAERTEEGDEEVPLEGLAGDVRQRRQREREPESDPFEQMEVGEVDSEGVWEGILSEEEMSEAERAVGAGVSATEVGDANEAERAEYIVPKDQFCGRCPYLSDPPGLACENDGTEIIEVTDSDHFRIRGCPFAGRDDSELAEFE